eukprot:CAMPEP_0167742990 /NCGR_PEP_ID=MMETSP0110_2-20121227/1757_1 /TAXON_ID=629695 /ORGANISM="Gymnochlora sp., Strain CCMP2014" /LENGTH=371 /DNA_ID=CAMNT_0007627291 /DNA_START=1585 /DNA_END=2697 /DNA_ORIENTATION=+
MSFGETLHRPALRTSERDRRCSQRANLQMSSILGIVLISVCALFIPNSSKRRLGYSPEPVVEGASRWSSERRTLPEHMLQRRGHKGFRPIFDSFTSAVGGGISGRPAYESTRDATRTGKAFAKAGGASGDAVSNKSTSRTTRGRPASNWAAMKMQYQVCAPFPRDWCTIQGRLFNLIHKKLVTPIHGCGARIEQEGKFYWGQVVDVEILSPTKSSKYSVAHEIADDLGIRIDELIREGLVTKEAATPRFLLRINMSASGSIEAYAYPDARVQLELELAPKIPSELQIKFPDLAYEYRDRITAFELCDRLLDEIEASKRPKLCDSTLWALETAFTEPLVSKAIELSNCTRVLISETSGRRISEVHSGAGNKW